MNQKRKLSKLISKMTPKELYAFVSATILELHRRSNIPIDTIIYGVRSLISVLEGDSQNDEHKDR